MESILGRQSLPPELSFWAALCDTSQFLCPCVPTILHCPRRLLSLCPMNPGHPAIPLQPPSALPPSSPTASPSSDLSGSSWHPSRTPYLWLLESAEHSSCDRFSAGPCHRAEWKTRLLQLPRHRGRPRAPGWGAVGPEPGYGAQLHPSLWREGVLKADTEACLVPTHQSHHRLQRPRSRASET